jgi:hypothetical protein
MKRDIRHFRDYNILSEALACALSLVPVALGWAPGSSIPIVNTRQ